MAGFNARDPDTYSLASDSVFVLNGKEFSAREEKGSEKFTEKKLVEAIEGIIRGISSSEDAREKIQKIGKKRIIARIIDNMAKGNSFFSSIDEMIHWMNTSGMNEVETSEILMDDNSNNFEIFDTNTWEFASTRPFLWKNQMLFSASVRKLITEKYLVDLCLSMFNFLERKGYKLSLTQKIQSITHLLDRMAKFQSDPVLMKSIEEDNFEKEDRFPVSENIFIPRNPDTYKFARAKPLTINGVRILTYYTEDGNEYDKSMTEKNFADTITALLISAAQNVKRSYSPAHGTYRTRFPVKRNSPRILKSFRLHTRNRK